MNCSYMKLAQTPRLGLTFIHCFKHYRRHVYELAILSSASSDYAVHAELGQISMIRTIQFCSLIVATLRQAKRIFFQASTSCLHHGRGHPGLHDGSSLFTSYEN